MENKRTCLFYISERDNKGDLSINTLILILLAFIVLSVLVMIIVSWKSKIIEMIGGIIDVKPALP